MYAQSLAKKEAFTALRKAIGKKFTLSADMIGAAPKPELGDFSFPCFSLAKGMGRNPAEIATELAAKIGPSSLIRKIVAVGPYVNFFVDPVTYGNHVLADILKGKSRYGRSTTGKGKKVLVEFANLNTHKEVHVGHLRNLALGQAVTNLFSANGYDATPIAYINDLGNNVARCLWGLTKFHAGEEPEAKDRLNFLGRIYTESTQAIGEDQTKRDEVSVIQRDLEQGTGEWIALWKKTVKWSLDDLKTIYDEFGLKLEKIYLEHELIEETHDIVNKLLTEGIAKMSEGATIVDLEEQKLGVNLLRKTDGTLLYNAKDLALALHKEHDYRADRSVIVVDVRQSLAFKQLSATLKKMDFPRETMHLAYDMVTLPEGAMSSRKGNIIRYSDLRDAMMTALTDSTRLRHADWKDKLVKQTAMTLALAAIKFMMLRQDPGKVLVFDMEEAMSTDGFSGPYILYTIARIQTLTKKSSTVPKADAGLLTHPSELALIRLLASYPAVVMAAGADMHLSMLAQYAFEVAQSFSSYYAEVRILDGADDATIAARLALVAAVEQTLRNVMDILNIDVVKAM
jgi:arginyl-tRNA synthetase